MFERPSFLLRNLYPNALWRVKTAEKRVVLTFDDGPVPDVTPWVLDTLAKYNIKATFFMVGENIQKHPEVFKRVCDEGHKVGNHTFNHLKAWSVSKDEYFRNINKSTKYVPSPLFRPPYGQLYPWYTKVLLKDFEKVVLWDVLSRDYDKSLTPQAVFNNVKCNVREGSIIVFHDSIKSFTNLKYALPATIEYLQGLNYKFDTL